MLGEFPRDKIQTVVRKTHNDMEKALQILLDGGLQDDVDYNSDEEFARVPRSHLFRSIMFPFLLYFFPFSIVPIFQSWDLLVSANCLLLHLIVAYFIQRGGIVSSSL